MSGIFDLFSATDNDSVKKLFSSDVAKRSPMATLSAKNVAALSRSKPKGLSLRSKSELNVTSYRVGGSKSPAKRSPFKGRYLKPESSPHHGLLKQISPRAREKNLKLWAIRNKRSKTPGAEFKSPKIMALNTFEEPPPSNPDDELMSMDRTPEKLAPYYDEENVSYSLTDNLDQEFVRLVIISKSPAKPYEDEGFESDPDFSLAQLDCDILDHLPIKEDILSEEEVALDSPLLPILCSISDDDDDDNAFF